MTTPPGRGRRAASAVLFALGLSVVLVVVTADGPDAVSGGLGGDYPSFYAAGKLVLEDPGLAAERFYDPPRQFLAQEPFLPSNADGNLYFAYPAFFVGPFALLAAAGFTTSYLLSVVLMVGAVAIAFRILEPCSATLRTHRVEAIAVALTFFPLFRGVTGGQNTALSLLLFAVVWRGLHEDREVSVGIAAGLLLFKPPLALPLIGSLLLARRYRAVAASFATAVALYVLGAVLTSPSWPAAWVDAVRYLDEVDTPFNVHNFVSLPGAAEALFGIDSRVATLVGGLLGLAVAVLTAWTWWRKDGDIGLAMAVVVSGALLISPHALYYDAGLLVLVGLVLMDRRSELRRWMPLLWAAGLSHLFADAIGVSPVVLLVLAAFVLSFQHGFARSRIESVGSMDQA